MSAIVISDGTYKPYHGFRHQVFWEILITMKYERHDEYSGREIFLAHRAPQYFFRAAPS